jgi:hypothetical protein
MFGTIYSLITHNFNCLLLSGLHEFYLAFVVSLTCTPCPLFSTCTGKFFCTYGARKNLRELFSTDILPLCAASCGRGNQNSLYSPLTTHPPTSPEADTAGKATHISHLTSHFSHLTSHVSLRPWNEKHFLKCWQGRSSFP